MSNNKGFSDTSAARYSLALYELANEANTIEEVEGNSIDVFKLISKNNDFKNFIKDPPMIKTMINEVKKDKPVLNVRYLKTFKKLKVSTKLSKNW